MDENSNRKSTASLLALFLAFLIGLTVGNIKLDAVPGLKHKSSSAAELSQTAVTLKSRNSTTAANTTEAAPSEEASADTDGDFFTIYRTPTGKKYHFAPDCAGKNRIVTDLDEATSLGLTPCKICADG